MKTKFQNKFQTVLCYEGYLDVVKLMSLIQSIMLACEAELAQSNEISLMHTLQMEQDAAYQKSLEIDKEKLRRRKEIRNDSKDSIIINDQESNIIATEKPKVLNTKSQITERISRALLDLEEDYDDSSDRFRIQFQFPDGSRKIRSFSSKSTTKVFYI